ncbi:uncharacterized protein [Aegilops tauschii subsp. strangulata]|uniref:uncharacterized protein isoform X2 n=1 Tax=Aegilops tauschii subsp. strangulata TaxID=200361 RepID=UPI001ABCB63A|nr:uncharacterized protein LOC109734078 isoform X3 [Aegilops tauschii subsp. strangulata]XP_044440458.1 uncharacterized protein LOC123166732 isoform X3 [Triticum aestivum]
MCCSRSSSTMAPPWWRWWGRTASPSPVTTTSVCSCRPSPPTSNGPSRSTASSTSASPASPPTPRHCNMVTLVQGELQRDNLEWKNFEDKIIENLEKISDYLILVCMVGSFGRPLFGFDQLTFVAG